MSSNKRPGKEKTPSEILMGTIISVAFIIAGMALLTLSLKACADELPPRAHEYLPTVAAEMQSYWPTLPLPAWLAGQIEQETCPRPSSPKCWNPMTENINPKNNGEYGWGLGQLTNTNKYNNFKDVTEKYEGLKTWKWEARFDPAYQIRTMIYMDKSAYDSFTGKTELDKLKFSASAYNGGKGGVLNDKKYCAQIQGCDPFVWDNNVETHSLKSRTKLGGYSISALTINRDYVNNIETRLVKYIPYFPKNVSVLQTQQPLPQ